MLCCKYITVQFAVGIRKRSAAMPKKGGKAVVQTPFNYQDMSDDQPSIAFLEGGFGFNPEEISSLSTLAPSERRPRRLPRAEWAALPKEEKAKIKKEKRQRQKEKKTKK